MVKTRAVIEREVDRDLVALSSLDDCHDSVKPLALDFLEAFRVIVDKYSHEAVRDVVTLATESLNRLNDLLKRTKSLELSLMESERDREALVLSLAKEKKNYSVALELALGEEEKTNKLIEENKSLQRIVSELQGGKHPVAPVPITAEHNAQQDVYVRPKKRQLTASAETRGFSLRLENRYSVLSEDSSEVDNVETLHTGQPVVQGPQRLNAKRPVRVVPKAITPCRPQQQASRVKRKVLLLTDSHGRGLSDLLADQLGTSYSVSSVVRPGARLAQVTNNFQEQTSGLGADDCVVILAGTNDVGSDSQYRLGTQIIESLDQAGDFNVIVSAIPHRFDREPLNTVIDELNHSLSRSVRSCGGNVFNIDTHLHRRLYTRHGLHMRYAGKKRVARALAGCIQSCSMRPVPPPPSTLSESLQTEIVQTINSSTTLDDSDVAFLDHLMSTPCHSQRSEGGQGQGAEPGVDPETPTTRS